MKNNDCCNNMQLSAHSQRSFSRLDDAQVSTQLPVPADSTNTSGLVLEALLGTNVASCTCVYSDLFCRCSSSLLSKMTDISSARTSLFFPSFRTPEIFCPFSTDTSKILVQGRTHRLNHTSQNNTSVNAAVL